MVDLIKALDNYDSAYDIDFLDKAFNHDICIITIGRLVDLCSDFKKFKKAIGKDKAKQLQLMLDMIDFYESTDCAGINLYDLVDYFQESYFES